MMPFELARFGLPNIAAIVALALLPLIALPMHWRHSNTAKAQQIQIQAAEQDAASATMAYAIAD